MIFNWYKIFNLNDFTALNVPSKNYQVVLDTLGLKNILVVQGEDVSVLFDNVLLTIELNDRNPFIFESRAVYIDDDSDVWVGVET